MAVAYNIQISDFLNISANFYWKDRNGVHLGCNDHTAHDTGLASREEYCGATIYDISEKIAADKIAKIDREIIETGQSRVILETSGSLYSTAGTYLSMKFPLLSDEGKVVGLFGISSKIQDKFLHKNLIWLMENKLLGNPFYQKTKVDTTLTKRESEIVSYLMQGMPTKVISNTLFISPRTVECHIANIKKKWKCRSVVELVAIAVAKGY